MSDIDNKICYICGKEGSDTVDHIPPKCLFQNKYRDNNLLTVPAHYKCNNSFSKDDEYFRDNIVIAACNTSKHACELFDEKIIRAFQREQAQGYRKLFIDQMSTVEIRTPSGVYVKTLPIKLMEAKRVDSVIERTCRGIYYHKHKNILPLGCPLLVAMLKSDMIDIRNKLLGQPKLTTVIPEIFEYVILSDNNDRENNLFFLFFYSCFVFHVSTGRIAREQKQMPEKIENYDKLEGIHFTDKTLWYPPSKNQ